MIPEGIKLLRPGGVYVLVGMVHPDSKMDVTAEQIIRKCITIKGLPRFFLLFVFEFFCFINTVKLR